MSKISFNSEKYYLVTSGPLSPLTKIFFNLDHGICRDLAVFKSIFETFISVAERASMSAIFFWLNFLILFPRFFTCLFLGFCVGFTGTTFREIEAFLLILNFIVSIHVVSKKNSIDFTHFLCTYVYLTFPFWTRRASPCPYLSITLERKLLTLSLRLRGLPPLFKNAELLT